MVPIHQASPSYCLQQIIFQIYGADCLLNLVVYSHPSSNHSPLCRSLLPVCPIGMTSGQRQLDEQQCVTSVCEFILR